MKKISTLLLVLLLTLSMISMAVIVKPTDARPIPTTGEVEWCLGGDVVAADLHGNPEFLKLITMEKAHSETTIIIQGRDSYGANIEAKVIIPVDTDTETPFTFLDYHSMQPVAFSYIDNVLQQGGTHGWACKVLTEPVPWEEYIGEYHNTTGFEPGQAYPKYTLNGVGYGHAVLAAGNYYISNGPGVPCTVQNYPVEPTNPDPLKILINWKDKEINKGLYDGDLLPHIINGVCQDDEWPTGGAQNVGPVYLYIEGLDEKGNKLLSDPIRVDKGARMVEVPTPPAIDCDHSWSTVCKVWGGSGGDTYYIFTHPVGEQELFYYYIKIDHMTIHPEYYDILANPSEALDENDAEILVALRDADGNLVHARKDITLNWATSGGRIIPSYDNKIPPCHVTGGATVYSDTNARTIRITCDANVPAVEDGNTNIPKMNLFVWTEMCFDGINSVLSTAWPIHTLMWGYTDASGAIVGPKPVPPKPVLPSDLAIDNPTEGVFYNEYFDHPKFDGPIYEVSIPIYVGCNLISSPVHPNLGEMFCEAYPLSNKFGTYGTTGIPMSYLFGATSATDCIEAIWWYDAEFGFWHIYVPGLGSWVFDGTLGGHYIGEAWFSDGIGYWIKAEKPCTLELSGVAMENAWFTPPEYPVWHSWNLMGFTSINPMFTDQYLESLSTDTYKSASIASAVGPIWTFNAQAGVWERDPAMLFPTNGFWMNYKLDYGDLAP